MKKYLVDYKDKGFDLFLEELIISTIKGFDETDALTDYISSNENAFKEKDNIYLKTLIYLGYKIPNNKEELISRYNGFLKVLKTKQDIDNPSHKKII